jgi:hypothetical protein
MFKLEKERSVASTPAHVQEDDVFIPACKLTGRWFVRSNQSFKGLFALVAERAVQSEDVIPSQKPSSVLPGRSSLSFLPTARLPPLSYLCIALSIAFPYRKLYKSLRSGCSWVKMSLNGICRISTRAFRQKLLEVSPEDRAEPIADT